LEVKKAAKEPIRGAVKLIHLPLLNQLAIGAEVHSHWLALHQALPLIAVLVKATRVNRQAEAVPTSTMQDKNCRKSWNYSPRTTTEKKGP
jgi:hypothetical protein